MSSKNKKVEILKGYRALNDEDLKNKLINAKEDLFWAQYKNRSGQPVEANQLRQLRKEVAWVNTIIREKAE